MSAVLSRFCTESRLCEFLLILPLPNQIREQAQVFKEEFEVLYGGYHSRHSIPHVTICDFLLFEHRTYDIMAFFKKRLQSMDSFTMKITGFHSYQSNKMVALTLQNSEEFEQLQTQVDITRQMLKLRKNYFPSRNPSIPIAKNLSSVVFEEAKEVFAARDFNAEFEVTHMDILKFDFITRKYQLFGQIPFAGR